MFGAILPYVPTVAGALESLSGGGIEIDMPEELKNLIGLLENRSKKGITNLGELKSDYSTRLGNEFEALSALDEQELTKSGAGAGVKQAARSDLNTKRLTTLGQGYTQLDTASENVKSSALGQLSQLLGTTAHQFTRDKSAGYDAMFGAGLNLILEQQNRKYTQDLMAQYLRG